VSRNQPLPSVKVDLQPFHVSQISGPAEQQRGQF
jgi:hypothetical protein